MKKILLSLLLPLNLFATDFMYSVGQNWPDNNISGNYSSDTVQINVTNFDKLIIRNVTTYGIGCSINGFIIDGLAQSEARMFDFNNDNVNDTKQFVFFDGNNIFVVNILIIDVITNVRYIKLFNNPHFNSEIQTSNVYVVDIFGNIIYMGDGGELDSIDISQYGIGMYILLVNDRRIKIIK
jgi:hypothetical protein